MKHMKTTIVKLLLTLVIGTQSILPVFAETQAGNSSEADEIAALRKEIAALEQKVDRLEELQSARQQTASSVQTTNQNAAALTVQSLPRVTLGANGFGVRSADTNFIFQIHGLVQMDSRSFFQDGGLNGNDDFLLRRARPIIKGTVFHDFDFNFTPEFGGSTVQILDAYVNYRFQPALQLQAGKFKSPVGLEQLQARQNALFNEHSLATDLVPNRDVGVLLHGDVFGGVFSYAVGLVNGNTDYNGIAANASLQDDRAVVGRMFFQPWKSSDWRAWRGLGFGVGGSYFVNHPQTNSATGLTPGYTTDGQQKFFTYNAGVNANGAGWRVSPQACYYFGPFGLLGEYVISDQRVSSAARSADLQNTAWEISGGWVLTGEAATYHGVIPCHPFGPQNGQWGAWQLVARFAGLNVDEQAFAGGFASPAKSADSAQAWAFGLNWYLNVNLRANASFSHTTFSGCTGQPPAVPAQAENVLFTRIQLAF